jgi:hypothetical protein
MHRWWVVTEWRDGWERSAVYATEDMARFILGRRRDEAGQTRSAARVRLRTVRIPVWVKDPHRWALAHPQKWKKVPARDV